MAFRLLGATVNEPTAFPIPYRSRAGYLRNSANVVCSTQSFKNVSLKIPQELKCT